MIFIPRLESPATTTAEIEVRLDTVTLAAMEIMKFILLRKYLYKIMRSCARKNPAGMKGNTQAIYRL